MKKLAYYYYQLQKFELFSVILKEKRKTFSKLCMLCVNFIDLTIFVTEGLELES